MTGSADLARLVTLVADDLEHRGYRAAGVVRQAARRLAELPADTEHACPVCDGPVLQTATTGRPRIYCTDRCRRRASKRGRKTRVVP